MLKSSLPFQKIQTSMVNKLESYLDLEWEIFWVLFLYEPDNIGKFSNMH